MGMLTNDWADALSEEFKKPYYRQLYQFVKEEYSKTTIFPPADDIFNALHYTPLSEVKVVILGQDPYHNEGQAMGLSFSVPSGVDVPPSLVNIYKELNAELGVPIRSSTPCLAHPVRSPLFLMKLLLLKFSVQIQVSHLTRLPKK